MVQSQPKEVRMVTTRELSQVIRQYWPRGLFLAKAGRIWIAVDNAAGYAWTEEFRSKRRAVRWLKGALY